MTRTVRALAAAEMRGRGFGTPELDRAAELIAAGFKEAGLEPGGDEPGSYFRVWTERGGDPDREVVMRNVVGVLPGRKTEWAGQSVVLGAHYDHLGLGWPDAKAGNAGKAHPGADDNASGVAVLVELARQLAPTLAPDRSVVFAAFTGEEAGRRGSRRYVATENRFPVSRCLGMINLDTVGRLGSGKLMILGAGSAGEWIHIFNGAGYVTGVPIETVAEDSGGSDQRSFAEAGVPAVQVFSGPNLDYHAPSDTAEKIDGPGLVKVAAVVREAIDYLAGRSEPLTAKRTESSPSGGAAPERAGAPERAVADDRSDRGGGLKAGSATGSTEAGSTRRVSLGTVPDFAYEGVGVRLSGVVPGSPAEKAGLATGDVVVRVGATEIKDLRALSEALKTLRAGERVTVTFLRGGKETTVETEVVAR